MGKKGASFASGFQVKAAVSAKAPRPAGIWTAGRMGIRPLVDEMCNSRGHLDDLTFEEFWNVP